jgi:hypothetical protein
VNLKFQCGPTPKNQPFTGKRLKKYALSTQRGARTAEANRVKLPIIDVFLPMNVFKRTF